MRGLRCAIFVLFYGLQTMFLFSELLVGTFARKVDLSSRDVSMTYRVGRKPSLISPLRNATAHLGRAAVFRCKITGSPSRIRWKKNKRHVPHTVRFRTKTYTWGGILRINNVRVSDYGLYSCKARNSWGHVTSNKARLIIKGVNPLHTERCEVYSGTLCAAHIDKRGQTFIAFGQTQRNVENTIQDTFRRMSSMLSKDCKQYLLPSLCKHSFPPCEQNTRTAKPVPVCKQDCVHLEEGLCKDTFAMAKAVSVRLRHQLPKCDFLPTAHPEEQPQNCQRIFSSKSRKETTIFRDHTNDEGVGMLRSLFSILQGVPDESEVTQHIGSSAHIDVIDTTNPDKLIGRCEPYAGDICKQHIQVGQNIFIVENRTQQGYEEKLTESLASVIPFTSTRCRRYALKALCYYFFPPCKADNRTPHLICRRDCEILEASVCSKEFQYAKTMHIAGEIIPDCSYLPQKQEACLQLGIPDEIPLHRDECSTYATGLRSQGKLAPKRPEALSNSSEWCEAAEYYETPTALIPPNLKKQLKRFGQTNSSILLARFPTKGNISKYCVKLTNQTAATVLNTSFRNTLTLPKMIRPYSDVLVPGLVFELSGNKTRSVELPVGFMSNYWPHKYMELSDVDFFYRLSPTHNTFVGRGRYQLCETNFSVEIKRTKQDSVRINGHSSDPVDVDTIERAFGVAEISNKLRGLLKKYGVFLLRLTRPSMEMYVSKSLSAKFLGTSYMEKFGKHAKTEVIVGKLHNKYLLTAGLIFEDEPLGKFVASFSGIYLRYLDMFQSHDGKNKIGLSLSAREVDVTRVPFMAYASEPLASSFTTSIPRGLYMAARTGTPKECDEEESLCKFLQIVLGRGNEFTLTGQTDLQRAHFKASIQNSPMKDHLPVDKVEIEVKTSDKTGPSFGFVPQLSYKVDGEIFVSQKRISKLIFTGKILYAGDGRQLSGELKSDAIWKKAFGYPQLTIKRMQAEFSIRLTKPHFPNKLETKADFEIGLDCKDGYESNCITGTAFIGMSDETNEQYFHGVISRFTIQDILRVHKVKSRLPAPIGMIGFPDGLEISFARNNHNLASFGGPVLRPGFAMRGRIRLLGFESDCSVNLNPNEFIVDADINGKKGPIKLGGVTPLYRSRHDRKNGPKLYLETRFSPKPYIKAYIDGYTRIFGIFDEIRILMTRRHFMIRMVTSIFKSFKVRINVMANYSEDLSRTHFKARIVFLNGLAKLTRASSRHIMGIIMSERLKLQAAQEEVNALRSECQHYARETCMNCSQSTTCKRKLYVCKSRLMAEGKPAYSKSSMKQFCQRLVKDSCDFVNCKVVCKNNSTSGHHGKSCIALEQAKKSVVGLQRSLLWITQAKVMFSSELFKVHAITFDTKLTPRDIGDVYVNAKLDVTLFGKKQRIEGVRLKFGVFARLASDVAMKAVEWYRKSPE